MTAQAIIFDFDGVLLESEHVDNVQLAETLTTMGHPTTLEQAVQHFVGLSGEDFVGAVESWIGRPLPEEFFAVRLRDYRKSIEQGLDAVAGAVAFVRGLPADLPRAIASSSTSDWLFAHLDHLGLRDAFGANVFSGREHVARGKPAPDIYLHAAQAMGVPIEKTVIIEDSMVGVRGAVASGARVIGLCAGRHCGLGHAERLLALGVDAVAADFGEVAALTGW